MWFMEGGRDGGERERQTDRQTDRQTVTDTDRQTETETDRETETDLETKRTLVGTRVNNCIHVESAFAQCHWLRLENNSEKQTCSSFVDTVLFRDTPLPVLNTPINNSHFCTDPCLIQHFSLK